MEQWQFLIQKQGDRSWHNLESPNLEISEGRYRVLARSNLRNTDVEIKVIHSSRGLNPPKHLVQKRSGRTNTVGLMPVIPFTYLKPGIWELQCSGDLMSDFLGQWWQYSIHLKVLPKKFTRVWKQSHTGGNLAPSLPMFLDSTANGNRKSTTTVELEPTVNSNVDSTDSTVIHQPVSITTKEGETEQILQNLVDLAVPNWETLLEDSKVDDSVAMKPPLPLALTLDREGEIAHWGEITVIHGRVEGQKQTNQEDEISYPKNFYALELVIELRWPLASGSLTQVRQPLPDSSLPIVISSAIDIPVDCQSEVILADINLYGAFSELGEVTLLANQSLTIRAIDSELFNLATTAPINHSHFIQSFRNKSLSLQLKSEKIKEASVQLPENKITGEVSLTEGVTTSDLVAESSVHEQPVQENKTRATINLEQLVMRKHRLRMFNNTFPFLKLPKVLPDKTEDLKSTAHPVSPELGDTRGSEDENTGELMTGDVELNPSPHLNSSPLIRKWMQSQGYSVPESTIEVLDSHSGAEGDCSRLAEFPAR
ncbi:hypothetical protein [Umezakia ovalisporum]|jgi:hypothetical protein|uniref:Uncharacterized protein n=2 Tax=Umezakia ovalisporum TaxID=75695 RepID=A0AA43KDZ7_9CYAN|nr:hypothetical protein [Umezakia ovalisporum]MBI1243128.1 hypothetical protein [Nostoc sp. RI_552]MDH6055475.1 hypothetical protein [Umezakia ovalisporum FSS-43]MDH6062805.1 hypothetical protein [Umezakia ovalisporum FSS-62]MDH6067955.1 hypothetical protein [Umezakia ovalisporum APH033B]MDH6070578.1 hypothetical protein [Umezakia ovalisporum CobakiLakeA]